MTRRGWMVSSLAATVTAAVIVIVGRGGGERGRPWNTDSDALQRVAAATTSGPQAAASSSPARTARAFAGQSDREAAGTAQQVFGELMRSPGWPDLRADPRVRVNGCCAAIMTRS